MKEKLEEIWDGLKERLKSPFLLTFLVVWSIQHWRLLYGVFSFDNEINYPHRVAFVYAYAEVRGWYLLFVRPVIWSFISMTLYLMATFLSEGITLFYSKWVRSWLYFLIDRHKLKTQDDIDELENRRKKLQDLVFDLRNKEEAASVKQRESERLVVEANQKLAHESSEVTRLVILAGEKDVAYSTLSEEIKQLRAKSENDQIRIKEQEVRLSALSNTKFQQDEERFVNLFSGAWLSQFERPSENGGHPWTGSEKFRLFRDSEGLYFKTDREFILRISEIKFTDEKSLSFTKTNLMASPTRILPNLLTINNSNSLVGLEDKDINISYSKVGP